MILWHLGLTVLVARYVFRDAAMDLRWVLIGSILPDLIDKPIAAVMFHDTFQTHRVYGHTLVLPVLTLIAVLLATSRRSAVRRGLIGLVIGWLLHLVLDGVWLSPEAFLWPGFGFTFPPIADSGLWALLGRMLRSPWIWAGEAVGAAYLLMLWRRRLSGPGEIRRFLRQGTIPL